jgi:hypothetical protein
VVERVVNVAIGRTYFATEITPTFLNFVFGGWRGVFGAGRGLRAYFQPESFTLAVDRND